MVTTGPAADKGTGYVVANHDRFASNSESRSNDVSTSSTVVSIPESYDRSERAESAGVDDEPQAEIAHHGAEPGGDLGQVVGEQHHTEQREVLRA